MHRIAGIKDLFFGYEGVLIGLLGTALLFKDLILAGTPDNVLWADDFDPRLIYWIVNWGYHILFEQRQPFNFWNANSFYPNTTTLAYSDSLLGMQLLFAPARMLGIPPLISLYLTLWGLCVIGATLTQYALHRIGYFSVTERILITFSAHFSLSVTSFLVHYQLFGFQLAPPFFLFLYLYLRDFKLKDLFVLLSLFAVGVSIAMYLAPMLLVLGILICVPIVWKQIKRFGFIRLFQKIGVRGVGTVAVCLLVLYSLHVKPYLEVAQAFPKQSFEETVVYSAEPASILTGFSKFSFWYGPAEYSAYGVWEYAYFPGFVLLTLAALYSIWTLCNAGRYLLILSAKNSYRCQKMCQAEGNLVFGDFILYMTILFLAAMVLSWGPYYKSDHSLRLPFYYLSEFVVGLDSIRAPGRFGMFIALPLAVLAVAFLRIFAIRRLAHHWVVLLVTILIVVESFPKFSVFPFSIDSEGVYKQVSQEIKPGTPLLELPVFGKDHFETIRIAMQQLNGSTIHWGRLVVGYGANKMTPQYKRLLYLDSLIQQGSADPQEVLSFAQQYGISHLLIHLNRYDAVMAEKWNSIANEGKTLFKTLDTIFLQIGD